jgi:hypothetical protein
MKTLRSGVTAETVAAWTGESRRAFATLRCQVFGSCVALAVVLLGHSPAAAAEADGSRDVVGSVASGASSPAATAAPTPRPPQHAAPPRAIDGPPSATQRKSAQTLYDQCVDAFLEGKFERALVLCQDSLSLVRSLAAGYRLAQTQERLGRLLAAERTFADVFALAQERGDKTYETDARIRWAALHDRIPALEIEVPRPPPPGLELTLNGMRLSFQVLQAPVRLDPGTYLLEARAPGYQTLTHSIALQAGAGALTRWAVPALVPESAPPGSEGKVLPWVVGGAGAAALATAVILTLVASSTYDGAQCGDRHADEPNARENECTPAGVRDRRRAGRFADAATVAGVLGVLGVGVGVGLQVLPGRDPQSALLRVRLVF